MEDAVKSLGSGHMKKQWLLEWRSSQAFIIITVSMALFTVRSFSETIETGEANDKNLGCLRVRRCGAFHTIPPPRSVSCLGEQLTNNHFLNCYCLRYIGLRRCSYVT